MFSEGNEGCNTGSPHSSAHSTQGTSTAGLVAAVVIGWILALLMIVVAMVLFIRTRRQKHPEKNEGTFDIWQPVI